MLRCGPTGPGTLSCWAWRDLKLGFVVSKVGTSMDMAWHESDVAMRPCINCALIQNGYVLRLQFSPYRDAIARELRARSKAKGLGWR